MNKFLHIFSILFLFLCCQSVFAVPAKRGVWKTITLSDGTSVRAQLSGDEHAHWWQAEDGTKYVYNDNGTYSVATAAFTANAVKRRQAAAQVQKKIRQIRRVNGDKSLFQGEKKGLIILVDFPNQSFSYFNTRDLFTRIANEPGYNDDDFNGSIRDYFIAQSGGQFVLDFDVVGPVTMSNDYRYYGTNDEAKVPEMIRDACLAVDSIVDFSKYDWDGDGEVEEVFVLYAGHGQADYDSDNDDYIWPHMYQLSGGNIRLTLDGKRIDTYACSSELNGSGNIAGIGTFCHEFSHCMGFPDVYDTADNGTNFGMGSWDLMDYGSYNGDGYTPAGYTGYERMVCGWTNPIEITSDTAVVSMKPLIDMGPSYIVYNKGNRNEYYILTNRQQHGYDAGIPGHGLLIEHIDYDKDYWDANIPNASSYTDYYGRTRYIDHQHITVFHANNSESMYSEGNAAYPYNGNDSLTRYSRPAATVYNANSDGSNYMNYAIRGIKENSDGTVSFTVEKETVSSGDTPSDGKGIIFHETFDKCNGPGGNDGMFSSLSPNSSTFIPDNQGWEGFYNSGGSQCAWFGSSRNTGDVLTPSISLPGDTVTLSFRAAGWNSQREGTELVVSISSGNANIIGDGSVTLTKGEFKNYSIRIVGRGFVKIDFLGNKRFFLDDVLVTNNNVTTGIETIKTAKRVEDNRIYNISGQFVGTDLNSLPSGLYIINGRKVVK